ncbi:hypothetical protein BV898_00395 [Hypsibius exemplaris]|uniref:WH2 domain-containing protein n=1 Tax=Hypsibius exemplaris TaxID=2072580 RepID=A0A1W0XD95_HYPEX|nr:hypothetical protein BV898_00395 [Hypsibius exemplaris]
MPPPPPRPPPGPPPPPAPVASQPAAKLPPASQDRAAVLLDIQKGARLKKVDRSQIKDRSSPLVPGGASAGPAQPADASGGRSNSGVSQNGPNGPAGAAAQPGRVQPPAGLGGLFANGMPTLKRTGFRPAEMKDATSPDENRSPPSVNQHHPPPPPPVTNQQQHNQKPKPPPIPSFNPPNGSPSRTSTGNPAAPPPPKPPNFNPNQRRSSGGEFTESNPLSPAPPKPPPNPKPPALPGNGVAVMTSGSATMHIQRNVERPGIGSMTLQKPKHPPPPLPSGPPPTRNISQTMPRPIKHSRPSLPVSGHQAEASPPTPPPVPGRPPSFRKPGDERPRAGPPPPPPPAPPSGFAVPHASGGSRPASSGPPRNGGPPNGYPVPPPMNGGGNGGAFPARNNGGSSSTDGLMNNTQQNRPAPPSRPPVTGTNGGPGIPQSASVQSLPGSPVRPPKRNDSLPSVQNDGSVQLNPASVAALNQAMAARNGGVPAQMPKQAPVRPPTGSSPRSSKISLAQAFEEKFNFHRIGELPPPMAFSGEPKTYPSSKARSVNRPLAPAPPV